MDIEKIKISVSALKAGGKVYKKDEVLTAPFPPAIVAEIRAVLNGERLVPTLEIIQRKGDTSAPLPSDDELAKAQAEAQAKVEADAKAKAETEQKEKEEADEKEKKLKLDAEAKAKTDAEAKAKTDAEAQAKEDAEAKVKKEAKSKKRPPVRKPAGKS